MSGFRPRYLVLGSEHEQELVNFLESVLVGLGFDNAREDDRDDPWEFADIVVIIWSPLTVGSPRRTMQADIATRRGVYVPVLSGEIDVDALPVNVRDRHVLDLRNWGGDADAPEIAAFRRAAMHLAGRAAANNEPQREPAPKSSSGGFWGELFGSKRADASAPSEAGSASAPEAPEPELAGTQIFTAPDHPYATLDRAPAINIFVAHASDDKPRIAPILKVLLAQGFPVWIDKPGSLGLAPAEMAKVSRIEMHDDWRDSIAKAIESADVVFAFWSREAIDERREQFYWEAYQGLIGRKLFQGVLDDMPIGEIGLPWTFRQIANLHDFQPGAYHAELDYIMQDMAARK